MLARLNQPMIVTPCSTTISPGRVSSQLPPRSAARSTITEPGAMRATMSRGDQHGRFLAGDHRGRDDDVALGDDLAQQLALALVERFVLGPGVAAGVLGVLGLDGQLDEPAAQALDLLLGGRPHVVGRGDRAQPPRRGDRLQARPRPPRSPARAPA